MSERIQIDRILCPVDFSSFSTRALRHAASLARRFEAGLVALHVIPFTTPYVPAPMPVPFPALAPANPVLYDLVKRDLGRHVAEVAGPGVAIEILVREAEPWREILTVAGEKAADLIVMGTHGRGGFEQLLLGSVAEKVVNRAQCPVLTVCHEEGRTWAAPGIVGTIVCATDLGPGSRATVRYAVSLAAECQSRLLLLHVIDRPAVLEAGYAHVPVAAPALDRQEALALQQLRELVTADERAWCEVEERVVVGRADEEILRATVAEKADMVVMGTRRQNVLLRAVLGSTSRDVVRAATCPVLTVRQTGNPGALDLAETAEASAARP